MAAELRYSCDVCGVQKGAANHWYVLCISTQSMHIHQWIAEAIIVPGGMHICGERCLITKISERLGRESFAADAPAKACTSKTCAHCKNVFHADLCGKCTACHEPICRQCANYRCMLLVDQQAVRKLNNDREVGAR